MTWHLIRATGIVAYVLLTASVIWGLWLSTRSPTPPGRPWVLEVHKALGGLAVLFTLGHLSALLIDGFIGFDLVEVLVPFASDWNPLAVAWGIVAFWLLAAVEVTSLLRRTLAKNTWRKVHLASFGAYLMASGHFLTAGTDSGNRYVLGITLGSFTFVALATLYRVTQHLSRPNPPKEPPRWRPPVPTRPVGPPLATAGVRPSVYPAGPPPSVPPPPSPPVR
jgi:DMSO/TMAO reductase YedYZ heme-binding membrane subunit